MFCTECGTENRNDRKFCTNCGKPLRDYTKPRENLLMPEDITEKQEKVKAKNKATKIFNIVAIVTFILAIACTVVIFFVNQPIKNIMIGVSIGLYIFALLVLFVKKLKVKKLKIDNN